MTLKKISARTASALVCLSVAMIMVAVALFSPFVDAARGPIGFRDLNVQTSSRRHSIQLIPASVGTLPGAGNGTTIGVAGVISAPGLGSGGDSFRVQTTTIAGFMWPQQLYVAIVDSNGSDTETCASVNVYGYDQFHRAVKETVLTIAEAGEYTNTVFERVTRTEWYDCIAADGSPGAGDSAVLMAPNTRLGFGFVIKDENDFVSVCLADTNATPTSTTLNCLALNDATSTDVQSAIVVAKSCGPNADERCSYFNVLADATLFQAVTPASGDILHVTFRPRF